MTHPLAAFDLIAIAAAFLALGVCLIHRQHKLLQARKALQQVEQELKAAREAAEAGYRSKSAFLATMSHEIPRPLNGAIATASLMLGTELTPEQRKSVETIQECSDILLELINDVLDFSKLEAGRLDLDECEFNLPDLCEGVFKVIEARAKSKNLTLIFAPQAKLPVKIVSDPVRVRQVLLNLVGNAVKFTEHGSVILRVSLVGTEDQPQHLRFEVEDTGIGISAEARDRLFTEFSQVEASITRRYGGTGLGLAICKKVVTAMAGRIGAESKWGKGSTFWFELPFVRSDLSPPLPKPVPAGMTAALIAADDPGRAAIAGLLEDLGVRVLACEEAEHFAGVDAVLVHIHHPLALDLIRGRTPPGGIGLAFIGYGFGSALGSDAGALRLIEGAVTPSAIGQALAAPAVSTEEAPAPKLVPSPPKRSSVRLAILLAEDNAINQRIAAAMLRNMGHSVDIAGNGRDALAKAQVRIYDVILMDMQMPGMDGLEATRAIRDLPGPLGQVPIVAMTANAFAADRTACLEAGMNDFIAKPITAQKLFDAIDPWTSGVSGAHDEAPADSTPHASQPHRRPAAPKPPLDPALVDAQQMQTIEDEVGEDGLHELLISFWADAANLLTELEQAMMAEDVKHAAAVLHTLKGSAANLGLIGCGTACGELRLAIAEDRAPDFGALLTVLAKTLQAIQPRLVAAAKPSKAAA